MKKTLSLLFPSFIILFLLTFNAGAQDISGSKSNTGNNDNSQISQPAWVEMDSFKQLLSTTFNAADKGDVAPIRKDAKQLTKLSIMLAKSTLPEIHDNAEMRTALGDLTDKCEELSQFINVGNADAAIVEQVTKLNGTFQEILALREAQLAAKK